MIMAVGLAASLLCYGLFHLTDPPARGADLLEPYQIHHPTVIAHRGASYLAPESTEIAYRAAIEAGAHYLEADIRRTRDGELVVFHDVTLRRTTNVSKVFPDRRTQQVHTFTLKELKLLDTGSWFNRNYPSRAGEHYVRLPILTLEQLLDIISEYDRPVGIVLDVKGEGLYNGIEAQITEVLRNHEVGQRRENPPIIFSPSLEVLGRFQDLDPELLRILLIKDFHLSVRRLDDWLDAAEEVVHGIAMKGFNAWPWRVSRAHERGLFVYPFVINSSYGMRVLFSWNSDGYVTDRPDFLEQILSLIPDPLLPEIN
jgi:glycerophosphoryl diester phosphodiesterase